ncbi:MAG: 5'-methylthioadenosine/S-adenosylhomocysteine nucleosidase [Deltaproteobacteria bacterium]|nr:5'-methylthioadenosine/S-adenosylhomocysteine nucleosidase [Deltaproteobacteria bacterium]
MTQQTELGIVVALRPEWEAVSSMLDAASEREVVGRQVRFGCLSDLSVAVIRAGFGKTMAAGGAQALIDCCRPRLLVDSGTAGALTDRLDIGDVVLSRQVTDGDLAVDWARTLALDEEAAEGLGALFAQTCQTNGRMLTTEHTVRSAAERARLAGEGFDSVDWETFAVIKTAQVNEVPCLSVRVISDRADDQVAVDFMGQAVQYYERLVAALRRTADILSSGSLPDLVWRHGSRQ